MEPLNGTGAIDRTQLPADVRSASREDQARYAAALQFEQLLVQRMLTQTLTGSGESGAEGGEEDSLGQADAVSTSYEQMIPELMARSLITGGGTGIARDLYDSMRDRG
jgi:Rod binding domain-containing protein